MSVDSSLIKLVLNKPERLATFREQGVTAQSFVEPYNAIWTRILRYKRHQGEVPSQAIIDHQFPDLRWPKVQERDIPILLHQLRERKRLNDLNKLLLDAASELGDPETVPDIIQMLQGGLNELQLRDGGGRHLVDIFTPDFGQHMEAELERRRGPQGVGLQTGFPTLDNITGGLHRKRMVVVMARQGIGKSWMDLLFVATAVINGAKVLLYPLEMSKEETAIRLYTIFSQKMFGGSRTLKNLDLSRGRVNARRFNQLKTILEDRFNGQLLVADASALSDEYTMEKIDAEVEIHQPDMFWVDYLTLLRVPRNGDDKEYQGIRELSRGVKMASVRHNCVGGCSAQVNREALKAKSFLPRLENISYGDSIGADADQVVSINRKGDKMFYALVKNRGGPEIGGSHGIMCDFQVDDGLIREIPQTDGEAEENAED